MDKQRIIDLFSAADSRNAERFGGFLAEDVIFRFGNSPVIHGKQAVIDSLNQFYEYLKHIRHDIVGIWNCDTTWIVETRAHYVDIYDRSFSFPACNIMICEDELMGDYRIFVDNSAMFIPPDDAQTE